MLVLLAAAVKLTQESVGVVSAVGRAIVVSLGILE